MHYYVPCECGARQSVSPMQAGTTIACNCGRSVAVPLLSELRRQAGQDAYITNARERIGKLLADGRVPTKGRCLHCGNQTDDVVDCKAYCEQMVVDRKPNPASILIWAAALLFRPFGLLLALFLRVQGPAEEELERGREVVVRLAFHLCEACRVRQELRKPPDLRAALQRVPEYAELFREYPEAELSREGC